VPYIKSIEERIAFLLVDLSAQKMNHHLLLKAKGGGKRRRKKMLRRRWS
jgi:hypothetical protein